MATEVKLPKLGQTMEEGTIVSCMVKPGDEVKKGDIIFEIETDKATLEMDSPAAGFVKNILVDVGKTIPVGEVMMLLGAKDEVAAPAGAKPAPAKQPVQAAKVSPQPAASKPATSAAFVQAPASANVVKLPKLGQTMEEGTIVSCMVKVGDEVKKGDVIFEVETDKATLEMDSPFAGFVKNILVQVGQTTPVGSPVIILANKDDQIPQSFVDSLGGAAAQASDEQPTRQVTVAAQTATPTPTKATGRIFVSPRAKKAAKDKGIDLAMVKGTGPLGRITEKDVKATTPGAKAPAAAPVGGEFRLGQTITINKLQKITAERMVLSKQQIPCFYLTVKVDMTDLVAYRNKLKEAGSKVAFNDFILRAVAMAMEKFPIMTGQLDGDVIRLTDTINLGLAVSSPNGLIVPVVKDTQKKTVAQIASDTQNLIEKAMSNKLLLTELEGACFTLTNLGGFGIDSFIPVVIPGQASILGVGKITDTCIPENGNILVRKLMTLTLSVDHKVANGAYAAQFLDYVRKLLEDTSTFK